MYHHRTIESFLARSRDHVPVVMVTGARQVGKTTVLRHLCGSERTYVTLDDPLVRSLAEEDPALFFQRYRPPLLIDEIQYGPKLFPYIKMAVDGDRRPGMFWLTGSQHFHLMRNVSESLAGRVGIVHLHGFSHRELTGRAEQSGPFIPDMDRIAEHGGDGKRFTLMELYRRIWRGAFPAIALDDGMDRDLFYSSYVQTYLQRDIRDLARVGDEMAFLRFLRVTAARTGQLLNMADLARDADISQNTAKSWLSILETSGLVYLLEPYHTNTTKRLIKRPKLYMPETGLAAYLTGWSSPETLERGAFSGPVLETWIVAELLKSYRHSGRQAPFHFYRDRDGREIDLLIERDGVIHPLEFKKTASPSRNDIRHFNVLENLPVETGSGGLICLAGTVLPLSGKHMAIPVGAL